MGGGHRERSDLPSQRWIPPQRSVNCHCLHTCPQLPALRCRTSCPRKPLKQLPPSWPEERWLPPPFRFPTHSKAPHWQNQNCLRNPAIKAIWEVVPRSSLFDSGESREKGWEWNQVLDNMSSATLFGYPTTIHSLSHTLKFPDCNSNDTKLL